ncbi:hypothetical protein HGT71_01380 [Rosenbergiella epipactidis]|uniref:virulence factor SrfB n=1 Tax=Rosenbergiella epipactidis TaxID=1544694 RepID=UPI001BD9349A|nr:virulence factor SrfB [Rosenbergiella epipactidis]MBT0716943.1 hypothetical protein [Rosenbergiella epipactidis]
MTHLGQQPQILFVDSGIQFIDHHIVMNDPVATETAFIRASVQGPMCEVTPDARGQYQYSEYDGAAVEWVRPEYVFSLSASLTALQHQWLPIPYFTLQGETCAARPINWARVYVSPHPQAEQGWDVTLAFDTKVSHEDDGLQPSQFEVDQGQLFALPRHPKVWQAFFQQHWVSAWMTAIFPAANPTPSYIWQAHYINLLKILVHRIKPRPLLLREVASDSESIAVEAIIDLGNSNSCGVLYEVDAHCANPLSLCSELQLRDLSCPTRQGYTLFSSELNFSPAPFGQAGHSSASGRLDAFQWGSLVRIGPEAQRLNAHSHHDLQPQGITCPRRYIWDDHPSNVVWFNACRTDQAQYSSIDHPLSLLLNDQGSLLDELADIDKFPVFVPQFSRSTLFTFLIIELVNQIAIQINSLHYRQRYANHDIPRVITRLTFTLPVNFTALERQRFRLLAERAITLIKRLQPTFFPVSSPEIEIRFPWDEACCGQIFWLWQQLRTQSVEALQQRYQRSPHTAHLRIALIDVGGGTTDVAVTEYPLISPENAAAPAFSPQLLRREGFTLAGDSLLEDIITHFLLPQLGDHLRQQGLTSVGTILERLLSREKSCEGDTVWRQYVVRHLLLPVIDDILQRYRLQETAYFCRISQLLDADVLTYIENNLKEKIACYSIELRTLSFQFSFGEFVDFLSGPQCRLGQLLQLISDTVTRERCDVVLLSGQVMELALFQQRFRQLPVHCCLLTELPTDAALPFCTTGKLANGKHATSLGGLLYALITQHITADRSILPGNISNVPVPRWYGPLTQEGQLHKVLLGSTCQAVQRTLLTITQSTSIGYRCKEDDAVIASPLFALIPNRQKIKQLVLGVTIELEWAFDTEGELLALPKVISVVDSQRQSIDPHWIKVELNTLSLRGDSQEYYWRDDGRVMSPIT